MSQREQPWQFKIRGMDCAEEVSALQQTVGPVVGGESHLAFDILNGRMTVLSSPEGVTPDTVQKAVARTGMRAELWNDESPPEDRLTPWQRHGRTVLTLASGLFALVGFVSHVQIGGSLGAALGSEGLGMAHPVPLPVKMLYIAGIAAGVWFVLPKAWFAIRNVRPDMNLLMTIAVVGASLIGEWFEAAVVAFLFSLSLTLESWSVGRARRAIAALLQLTPATARVRRDDGTDVPLPPEQVSVGAVFVVMPGERLPLDGRVVRGTSDVNQAPITGEGLPVAKQAGDSVFAGTINGDGVLEVECTKPAGESTLAHIVRMVKEAQSRRGPSERWVERFARVYTPVVMAMALAVLIVPPLLFGGDWGDWFYRSLVLLVIACPCALVVSTPVSVVAALAAAARNGVLVKGGAFIEAPAGLAAIALDKTGTLTNGDPSVVEIVPLNNHSEAELLERAAALELRSGHPLAKAVVNFAKARGIQPAPAADVQVIQGKGATGSIRGERFWLGSHRYLEERGQETSDLHARLQSMSGAGRSVVVIGNERHVCGLISLADTVRSGVRSVLAELRGLGVQHIVMLTGDNRETADAIARETGVDEVHAELLPADKVAAMEALVTKYERVAMVGDGVNDAPVLGRATVGIAMGAGGSDVAIETADIALMSDDLAKIPWLIRHSRRTLAVIRQNIVFSLAIKALFVLLTFAGFASLWAAIAADMGASLLVIFNGLRLLASVSSGTPATPGAIRNG